MISVMSSLLFSELPFLKKFLILKENDLAIAMTLKYNLIPTYKFLCIHMAYGKMGFNLYFVVMSMVVPVADL